MTPKPQLLSPEERAEIRRWLGSLGGFKSAPIALEYVERLLATLEQRERERAEWQKATQNTTDKFIAVCEQRNAITDQVKTLTEQVTGLKEANENIGEVIVYALRSMEAGLGTLDNSAAIENEDALPEYVSKKVASVVGQVKTLTEQVAALRKWSNCGGAPTGRICKYDPKDEHEIYGPFRSNDAEGLDCICEVHFTRLLEDQVKTLREALEKQPCKCVLFRTSVPVICPRCVAIVATGKP